MIDIFARFLLALNELLFNNLGLTIIVIGVASRLIFYPFFAQSIRYTKAMRDLKPKLDELKKKYGHDMRRSASEQSRLFRDHGLSPAAGAVSCISMIVQLVVFILLFQSLSRVIASGVDTSFLFWDLGQPDAYKILDLPFPVPGILVFLTAALSFVQSKMVMSAQPTKAEVKQQSSKKESKPDLGDALSSTQGLMTYYIPIIILIFGARFSAGLALYWLISTVFGIIQQYLIAGPGGLKPWLAKLPLAR
ncbi:MAG TPA: YidC/Oxa1 family membrane protein insertase [Candidatus Nanoarchaeia archaeon]